MASSSYMAVCSSLPICPPCRPTSAALSSPAPPIINGAKLTRSVFSRTLLALMGSFSLQEVLLPSHPAMALSLGISGPKEWLKGQKKKTADYLLAPINVSRERLKTASSFAETASPNDIEEAQKLVKSAARDCTKPEDGSLVAFQVKTGVEVCTFRLILKNAASLLDDADPVKLNANLALDNLISSFTMLDNFLTNFTVDSSSNRNSIADAFGETNDALDSFEKGVRECLGIA
ncbi:hypothetical protein GOP47_0014120 [Adiantum capillus-veneris]|uniref:Chloroplast thylakoid membrane n=1 Tax=Adiantum capillus-veneris TaxID=13818 RepID=A0A9D4UPU1_ADICA|nr:hypothetical protein GOP47_0014120 [Adiantum capillus-veneris]